MTECFIRTLLKYINKIYLKKLSAIVIFYSYLVINSSSVQPRWVAPIRERGSFKRRNPFLLAANWGLTLIE